MRTRCLAVVLALVGCSQPQRLIRFHAPAGEADPVDVLVRAFVENGQQPADVDATAGIVRTAWEDTGFMYGQVRDQTATIHRRYTAIVTRAAGGADVVVRIDTKRCAPRRVVTTTQVPQGAGGTTISVGNSSVTFGGSAPPPAQVVTEVEAPCEAMDSVVSAHQEQLEAMAETLRVALHGSPNPG